MSNITYQQLSCPNCANTFDMRFFGFSTRLGPPKIQCSGCSQVIASDRKEWPWLEGVGRGVYVFWSIVGAVLLGLAWGAATASFGYAMTAHTWDTGGSYTPLSVWGYAGMAADVLFIFVVQILRVFRSISRSKVQDAPPFRLHPVVGFLGTQFNLMILACIPILVDVLLAKLGVFTHH